MIETTRAMEKLRGLLLEVPFPHHEALGVAKELMLHGINDRNVRYFHQAAMMLLERVFRPALQGNVEQESMLKRLMTRLMRQPDPDPNEVTGEVSKMIAGLDFPADPDNAMRPSREEADHFANSLLRIPGFPIAKDGHRPEAIGWRRVDEIIDACILEHGRKQRQAERAWQRRKRQLVRLAETLIQAAERIHHPTDELHKALQLLECQEALPVKLAAFIESLLIQARQLKEAMNTAKSNIERAESAILELNGLFRQADLQLLHARDQEMIDIFTGLGNRFALTEHRKRHVPGDRQSLLFIFFDEDPEVHPKIKRTEVLRILGFIGRRIHKLELGLPFHIGDETIAIILAREIIDNPVAEMIKEKILDRLQATKGFPTHIRFGVATLHATATTDEETLLTQGKQWTRISAQKGGLPLSTEVTPKQQDVIDQQ
ncbi:MAG: hypothetical protein HQL81_15055 [Magnetococcales bacterium]|nr:hypothetical protein [Magnetococcales bacterium]